VGCSSGIERGRPFMGRPLLGSLAVICQFLVPLLPRLDTDDDLTIKDVLMAPYRDRHNAGQWVL